MSKFSTRRACASTFTACLGLAFTGLGSAVGAEQGPDGGSGSFSSNNAGSGSAADSEELQELVVTAERRTTSAMTTASAVTSMDQSQLEKNSISSLVDLQYAAPSMSIQPTGVSQQVNIRGIGQQSTDANAVPGVPIYQDGLLLSAVNSSFDYFDLKSVEVLRGPQGTFAGASSIGGAIFMKSADPELTGLTGNFEAGTGNYSDVMSRGALNIPISSTVAVRVAYYVENRKSFFRNIASQIGPGPVSFQDPGALNEQELRVGILWQPTDDLRLVWKTQVGAKSTGGYPYIPLPDSAGAREYPGFQTYPTRQRVLNDVNEQDDEKSVKNTLQIDWELANGITIRSITGAATYRTIEVLDDNANSNAVGNPANYQQLLYEHADQPERDWQQEFDVLSTATGRFQWLFGTFYFHAAYPVFNRTIQAPTCYDAAGNASYDPAVCQTPNPAFPTTYYQDAFTATHTSKYSVAPFFQTSYQLTSKLKAEFGARLSHDHSQVSGAFGTIGSPPTVFTVPAYSKTLGTGKFSLDYQLNPDNFLYAFAAKGASSGGESNNIQFQPTIDKNYEIGWKSYLFDRHVRLQLDAYHNDITNQQFDILVPANGTVTPSNIPKAKSDGIEGTLQAQAHGFSATVSVAYSRTKVGNFDIVNLNTLPTILVANPAPQCAPGQIPTLGVCNDFTPYLLHLSGKSLPYSPEWTFSTNLEYTFMVGTGDGDTLVPRIGYTYQSSQWGAPMEQTPDNFIPSHGLLNAQLEYTHGRYAVIAYGTNLTDKIYVSGMNVPNYFLGPPRQFGVRAQVKF
jgi:iron complex outermembrane receptor protein